MNQYYEKDGYCVIVCSDGTEIMVDDIDVSKLMEYNWFRHNTSIEGNKGGKGPRVTIGRVLFGESTKHKVLRIDSSVYDYRRLNLYTDNEYEISGDIATGSTITGDKYLIDVSFLETAKKFRWYVNSMGYMEAKQGKRRYLLHRMVANAPETFSYNEVVDHINRCKTDNRAENLRIVTQSENARNSSMKSSNKSGYLYVHKNKNGTYNASIPLDGKQLYLGTYDSPIDAKNAIEIYERTNDKSQTYSCGRHKKISNTSEKYVYRNGKGKYVVTISGGDDVYLGVYDTVDSAILARDTYLMQAR